MNVVVLVAHGLNCHWLGPYGNEWVSTPALDALAAAATVFDRHFAGTPTAGGFRADVDPALTAAFTVLVDDRKDAGPGSRAWDLTIPTDPGSADTPGGALVAAVQTAVQGLAGRADWLLWIETDRLVPPWDFEYETYQHYAETTGGFTDDGPDDEDLPEPIDVPQPGPMDGADRKLWHQVRNSFAAAVSSLDGEVGRLIEVFRRAGLDQSATWVFTSGYGYPLGEHGVIGPGGARMHVESTHLPLIVRIPGMRAGRVASFTRPADLGNLLRDPLAPIRDRVFVCSRLGAEVGIRTADWTFLPASDHPPRLYLKPDDLWEVNDVAARHPDECDRLAALIPPPPEPTP